MAANNKTNKQEEEGKIEWLKTFERASSLTITIVFFPVVFLLAGVWLDKRMDTTPLFILLGIIVGTLLGIYIFIREGRKLKDNG